LRGGRFCDGSTGGNQIKCLGDANLIAQAVDASAAGEFAGEFFNGLLLALGDL